MSPLRDREEFSSGLQRTLPLHARRSVRFRLRLRASGRRAGRARNGPPLRFCTSANGTLQSTSRPDISGVARLRARRRTAPWFLCKTPDPSWSCSKRRCSLHPVGSLLFLPFAAPPGAEKQHPGGPGDFVPAVSCGPESEHVGSPAWVNRHQRAARPRKSPFEHLTSTDIILCEY
jgi:hypothetical protein